MKAKLVLEIVYEIEESKEVSTFDLERVQKRIEIAFQNVVPGVLSQEKGFGGPTISVKGQKAEAEPTAELIAACEWVLQDMSFKAPEQFANESVHGRWIDRLSAALQSVKVKKPQPVQILTEKQFGKLARKLKEFGYTVLPQPYWLLESAYCLECAQSQVRNGFLQGQDVESDCALICKSCGCGLAHTLTPEGADAEMVRLEAEGVDLSNDLTKYTLHNIARYRLFQYADRMYLMVFPDK